MITYIAFLRGINVSGQKLIKMVDLKVMFEKLGFTNVSTYIQSGNIVFTTQEKKINLIQKAIKKGILTHFGHDVDLQVLTSVSLKNIAENHSFLNDNKEQLKSIYYTLLAEKPNYELVKELEKLEQTEEFFKITDDVIYCFYPNGIGKAKWHGTFFEKKLKVSSTTRNYNTIHKLGELSQKIG